MDYSKLNDHELNCKVALNFYDSDWVDKHWLIADMIPDYCNNPADAWPVIADNHIGIMPFKTCDAKAWPLSIGLLSGADVRDKNPLRAAMIVFLMMKDAENGL